MSQTHDPIEELAFSVRPTVGELFGHPPQDERGHGLPALADDSDDSAHGRSYALGATKVMPGFSTFSCSIS